MTAVDFAAFVERLAQVSGEVIVPFFRSAIRAEDKSKGGVFDPAAGVMNFLALDGTGL